MAMHAPQYRGTGGHTVCLQGPTHQGGRAYTAGRVYSTAGMTAQAVAHTRQTVKDKAAYNACEEAAERQKDKRLGF